MNRRALADGPRTDRQTGSDVRREVGLAVGNLMNAHSQLRRCTQHQEALASATCQEHASVWREQLCGP